MIPEWLWASGLTGLVTGLISYGGMRVELRWLHEKIKQVETTANKAHQRLDEMMLNRLHTLEAKLFDKSESVI